MQTLFKRYKLYLHCSLQSVQFRHWVVSDSLRLHESQHARPPCPSPTPGVHSDSCPSSQWRHPAISSSVVPFSSCLQSLPASVFSNESTLCVRWPKYWSFSIIPSKEHPGPISFRMDWLDLLVVQGTLKSLLQHHSSKASILQRSAFFTVQLSHPYMLLLSRFSRVQLCATPQTAAHQVPLSLGFSRQEQWNGLPFPSPMHKNEKWKWSRSVVSNS